MSNQCLQFILYREKWWTQYLHHHWPQAGKSLTLFLLQFSSCFLKPQNKHFICQYNKQTRQDNGQIITPSSLCTLRAGQIEMRAETGEFEHETTRITLAGVFRVNLILALLFSMICFDICSSGGCLSVCRPCHFQVWKHYMLFHLVEPDVYTEFIKKELLG